MWILAAAVLILVGAGAAMRPDKGRVFIDDVETQTEGNVLCLGSKTGEIRADGDVRIRLDGEHTAESLDVWGRLYIYGDGKLTVNGSISAGSMSVSDGAEVHADRLKLRRTLDVSPLYTVKGADILPPYTASLCMGGLTADRQLLLRLGDSVPVPDEPGCEGYVFDGWYSDEELTESFDFGRERYEDTCLYASWIKLIYTYFDSWGGSDTPRLETLWGARRMVPDSPERDGYTFGGWYSDDELKEQFDFSVPATENASAYAKWIKNAEARVMGIDVARYQLDIKWNKVKAAGAEFAIIRAGYRGYGEQGALNTDDNFAVNIEGAQDAGLDIGVYFFSQAINEAEAAEEADYVLDLIKGYDLTLPVFFDFELVTDMDGYYTGRLYKAGLSDEEYAAVCLAFCRRIENAGYTAMVYAGKDMLEAVGGALEDEGYGVWLANWTVQTRYNGQYEYWQYSGNGSIDGIMPTVDLNSRYINSPGRVTGLEVNKNMLSWDKQPGAYGYIIYRCTDESGGYVECGRTKGAAKTEFTDSRRPEGSKYMVCAYVLQSDIEYRGGFSDAAQ